MKKLRIIVAVPRSGSTLLMRILSGHPEIAVTSRNVLMGKMEKRESRSTKRNFTPDYSIFSDTNHHARKKARLDRKRVIVSKEEFGNDRFTGTKELNECNYDIFGSNENLEECNPIFIFRDPCRVFDSWLKQGWDDIDSFILSYQSLIDSYKKAKSILHEVTFYTHEYLTRNNESQRKVVYELTKSLGVDFKEEMLNFGKKKFNENFTPSSERDKKAYNENMSLFNVIKNSEKIISDIPPHGLIKEEHIRRIQESGIINEYNKIHEECLALFSKLDPVQNNLKTRKDSRDEGSKSASMLVQPRKRRFNS